MINPYSDFMQRFKLLAKKEKHLVINTLSNIFTMRLIGNKTHGDLAEVGIAEFINQFMYDFKSNHVGKELFRAKEREEDIEIINELTDQKFPVSLKAYGDGPLQLSTDRNKKLFPYLQGQMEGKVDKQITEKQEIEAIFASDAFQDSFSTNIMPLIYNEKEKRCNIMVFDYQKAIKETAKIIFIRSGDIYEGKSRRRPTFMFVNQKGDYIFEVRYGDTSDSALSRGLWTHTKNALNFFDSLTNGWIYYSHNKTLVRLFSLALNSTEQGHEEANLILQKDIDDLKLRI